MAATLAAGLALLGVFGGCGPGAGTCAADGHTVIGPDGNVSTTCLADQACTSDGTTAACVKCDPTECLPKNDCVSGWANTADALTGDISNKTTTCRLTCTKPTDCPFNYSCVAGDGGQGYCAKDRAPGFLGGPDYKPAGTGEAAGGAPWGVPCDPAKGFDQNADCDQSQSFWCYGTAPTDANAFCTQFQCGDDADCPGGWWCATINNAPNVTSAKRQYWGADQVTSVCLPRVYDAKPGTYCAPCKSDFDCPADGTNPQHCVSADANGGAETVCAAECQDDSNCPLDQKCADPGSGTKVCVPRAATCKGDGSMCSPCHSDADCTSAAGAGYCVQGDYSTEHFCTVPTPTCTYSQTSGFTDQCPKLSDLPPAASPPNTTTDGIGCSYNAQEGIPLKQCYGGNTFGLGCYTFHCAGVGGTCFANSDCCDNKCNTSTQACQ